MSTKGISIKLNGLSIGLDSLNNDNFLFISHAHTDHLIRNVSCPVITSPLTSAMAKHRMGLDYTLINDSRFELIDSGHVVGSKALLVETEKEKILYTGDFTTRDRFFLKGLKPVKCDTLIMETTYGIPEYDLPSPDKIICEARDVILDDLARGYNPCLVGYAFGKSQLITKIAEGLGKVYAHESVRGINNICRMHGCKINVPDKLIKSNENFIYITPNINDSLKINNARTYSFTGWGLNRSDCFPLSDHAGFTDLLRFVKSCKPQMVLTHHGFSEEFAEFLRSEGYNAKPI